MLHGEIHMYDHFIIIINLSNMTMLILCSICIHISLLANALRSRDGHVVKSRHELQAGLRIQTATHIASTRFTG